MLFGPKVIYIILFIIFVAAVLIAFIAVLVAPERCSPKMAEPFKNRYFAHRGLHTKDKAVPENSLEAFDRACKAGYGIELDVRLTQDGEVVVVHDPNLNRMCGVDKDVDACTYEEISLMRLNGTGHHLPRFQEALNCIAGRVPIIVEIKPCADGQVLTKKTMDILAPYTGDYAVESFDPGIVRWLRYNAPVVLRGQLAMHSSSYDKNVPGLGRFFMSRCLFGMVNRPHFIAYEVGPKPLTVRLAKLLGAIQVVWTSRPKEMGGSPETDARNNDIIIFEFYEPPLTKS